MTGSLDKQEMNYPTGKYVSVYITSKRIHAAKLLELRERWTYLYFTARWPVVRDISFEQGRPARLWLRDNEDDMLRSDVVVCYAEKDDQLNTSIFELGAAYARHKPIYLVGNNLGFKEWQHAEGIQHFETMDVALQRITDRLKYRKSDADKIMEAVAGIHTRLDKQ